MVASTHWLASAAGMAVLEQGGNAFDAAVAAGFTLKPVEPHLNGPGGDLPALLGPAGARPVVCGALQRNAQLAATYRRIFEDSQGDVDAALECWYRGFVADAFLRLQGEEWLESSGARHAGLPAESGLGDWRATYEAPLAVDYA